MGATHSEVALIEPRVASDVLGPAQTSSREDVSASTATTALFQLPKVVFPTEGVPTCD